MNYDKVCPCPFCGHQPNLSGVIVYCDTESCGICGQGMNIDEWNRRYVPPKVVDKLNCDLPEELRAQANQHPLDADLTMFDVAASEIDKLNARIAKLKESLSTVSNNLTIASLMIMSINETLGDDYSADACKAWEVYKSDHTNAKKDF